MRDPRIVGNAFAEIVRKKYRQTTPVRMSADPEVVRRVLDRIVTERETDQRDLGTRLARLIDQTRSRARSTIRVKPTRRRPPAVRPLKKSPQNRSHRPG
jgi:hypothetical protein